MRPSTKLLLAGAVGAAATANAERPLEDRGAATIGSFAAGVGTSELPLLHAGVHGALALGFAARGGGRTRAGRLGLLLTAGAVAGSVAQDRRARRAGDAVEAGLVQGLGASYRAHLAPPPAPWSGRDRTAKVPVALATWAARRRWARHADVRYGPHAANVLDVWKRDDLPPDRPAPVVVQVHGGAWVTGSKVGQAYPLLSHLVEQGWICVAVGYRLAPKHPWPAQVEDVLRAVAWTKEHIASYGGDPSFVAITGGSAGGHLTALAALAGDDPAFNPDGADVRVQAAVPFYGVYDWSGSAGATDGIVRFLAEKVVQEPLAPAIERYRAASPSLRVRPDAPPFFVVHGDRDVLAPVAQARTFVDRLRATSTSPVAYAELPGAHHAFDAIASTRTLAVVQGVDRFLAHVRATGATHAAATVGGEVASPS